jgi:integrase
MLPGAHRVAFHRAGKWRIYWYADRSRGAPLLWSGAGDSRDKAEEAERIAAREIAERYSAAAHPRAMHGFVSRLVEDFKASDAWAGLAPSTKKLWAVHLDDIKDTFGNTSLAGIQRKGVRKLIKQWHAKMEETPRKANTALTVLVRLFEYGVDVEDLERNPAAGLARLDEGEGRAGIVWSEDEFASLLKHCAPAMARALKLEWHTGFRREDLIRLRWDEIDFEAGLIRRPVLKSRKKKRLARIPLTPDLRSVLEEMPKTAVQVVTKGNGAAYATPGSFSSSLLPPLNAANVRTQPDEENPEGLRKHLHDIRGTRATQLFADGASDAEAEGFFGWAPGSGGKMRGIYGDPESIALASVKRQAGTAGQR